LRRSIFERGKRIDLPAGCPERIDWPLLKFIWRFDRVTWPRIDAARIEHGAAVPTYWLRSRREISDFFAVLPLYRNASIGSGLSRRNRNADRNS
jgi:hypothetical protein